VRLLAAALFAFPPLSIAAPDPLVETRHCGEPARTAAGLIIRRVDVLIAFRKLYACPATGEHSGPCPGWAIDHVIPLAVGGCDAVRNLQWLPTHLKSCAGNCKDRWERDVYRRPPP
jgi:hypothetical protein